MDCFFHSNVPSVAPCVECGKPICATCRDDRGGCPSCRLAAKVEAATATRQSIAGQVPPRAAPRTVRGQSAGREHPIRSSREPWLHSVIRFGRSRFSRSWIASSRAISAPQALQALGFNVGFAGFGGLLVADREVPFLGFSASDPRAVPRPLFLWPACTTASRVWNGDEVRVP